MNAEASIPTDYILIPRIALESLPTSGTGWSNVLTYAAKPAAPQLSNQDNQSDVITLAKALVVARTGDATRRAQVVTALQAVIGTEKGGRALALGRGLGAYVLAADFIGYRDPTFVAWVSAVRRAPMTGGPTSLIACHEQRPNNWGTHCGASRIAADLYLNDVIDLDRAATVFRGWAGDRSAYAGFKYGDLSWQTNSSAPVGINPDGSTLKASILADDMRRGGSYPTIGSSGVSYSWEALQGVTLTAELLTRAGYPAWTYSTNAVGRAVAKMYAINHGPTGDDMWIPSLVNHATGTHYVTGSAPGKGFGFTNWLYQ